jgi:transposase
VIGPEAKERIVELREQDTLCPVTVFYENLVEKEVIKPQDVSYSSVYRMLKRFGLIGERPRKEPERKRFAYDKVTSSDRRTSPTVLT